ncbi:MAG: DUF302 domain-containing protein [Octadecabacter sp.]|nr:DUF302 domain-containing protein [Octadecabacter sp.]
MKTWIAAAVCAVLGTGGWADMIVKDANGTVAEAMDRLEGAVTGAGATVFARVDHGAGAMSVDMELADAQLLMFGNPMLGTPVMQQDIRAGLVLPLHVLIYDDNGTTRITYEDIDGMVAGLDVDRDAEVFTRIEGALNNLTNAAAGQ